MKVGQHGQAGHGRVAGRGDPDGQWPRTVKVVLVHSYGPQNNDKVKEPANEVAIFARKPSAWQGY